MENRLLTTITEASYAVCGEAAAPRFTLTADEAGRIKAACERAQISGQLMDKMRTLVNFATVKERFSGGKFAVVEMR